MKAVVKNLKPNVEFKKIDIVKNKTLQLCKVRLHKSIHATDTGEAGTHRPPCFVSLSSHPVKCRVGRNRTPDKNSLP